MSDQLVIRETQAIQPAEAATGLLDVISRAVADPNCDVAKMEKLFDLHQRILKDQREVAFIAAKTRLADRLPLMAKHGKGKNSRYAKLEDIHLTIKPLLAEEGFCFDFDEESRTDKTVTFKGTLSHKDGHTDTKRLTVQIDQAAKNRDGQSIRPAIQDDGSTVSYARRYLIKMHLDLVETNEDTDGESQRLITDDQVKTIETLLSDTKSNLANFLSLVAGVARLEDIPARDYQRIINNLEVKRQHQHGKTV